MSGNVFDSGAWYLLSYTNTLSFGEWRETVKQAYGDLERKVGIGSAKDHLAKMVAYYCMEVAPGKSGRAASSAFRKVHQWGDYRESDAWWLDEWKSRRAFDIKVGEMKSRLSAIPSVAPEIVHNDSLGRAALTDVMAEASRRLEWARGRWTEDNLPMIELCARHTISLFGGEAVLNLYDDGILRDWDAIPTMQSMYFVERVLVSTYGENLIRTKSMEYA